MTSVPFIGPEDIDAVVPFDDAIAAMEQAFRSEAAGEWRTPRRIAASNDRGVLLAMPAARTDGFLGAKLVTSFPSNSARGLPGVFGVYALFDGATGRPAAILDGTRLTLVRTAAVSAVAVKLLARPDAATLGVLGAGGQGEFHARVLSRVKALSEIRVWGRSDDRAGALVGRLVRAGLPARVATRAEAASSDIVVTATASAEPVLESSRVADAACVCAIGAHTPTSRELDGDLVARARTLAIETRDALEEAGDLVIPAREGRISLDDPRIVTLAELVTTSPAPGARDGSAGPAVFKSCGVAFEDLALASLVALRLRASGRLSL
jgi:ornithine cyclodeaminase